MLQFFHNWSHTPSYPLQFFGLKIWLMYTNTVKSLTSSPSKIYLQDGNCGSYIEPDQPTVIFPENSCIIYSAPAGISHTIQVFSVQFYKSARHFYDIWYYFLTKTQNIKTETVYLGYITRVYSLRITLCHLSIVRILTSKSLIFNLLRALRIFYRLPTKMSWKRWLRLPVSRSQWCFSVRLRLDF